MPLLYHTIFINFFFFILLISAVFIYKRKFPSKSIFSLPFLILFSLPPLLSLLRFGAYESGDMVINAYKTIAFVDSLRQGVLRPLWAGGLNAGYGYPLFIFTYPLPYFLASFFNFLGFNFIDSIKMLLASSYLLSGIFMQLMLKERFKSHASFIGTLLYLYAPYHLLNMHYRVDIGEMWAMTFMPFVIFCLCRLKPLFNSWTIIGGGALAILILSHQAISLSFLPLTFIFLFILYPAGKYKKYLKSYIFLIIIGLLLSAFYYLPVLVLKPFTLPSTLKLEFLSLPDLLYSPFKYGMLYQGSQGKLALIIGYSQVLFLFLSFFYHRKMDKQTKSSTRLIWLYLAILIFMMLSISSPIWKTLLYF